MISIWNFDNTVDCLVYTYSALSGHFTGSVKKYNGQVAEDMQDKRTLS